MRESSRFLLAVLMFCFALGSWLGINGIFSQTAYLINSQPEGYALPSQISIAVQCSNLALILYLLYVVLFKGPPFEMFFVLLSLVGSVVGLVLLSFFWDATAMVGSTLKSVGVLTLTVWVGMANTLTSPVFFPILTQYPAGFTTAFAAGEASTGLVAALLALIQQAAGFSPTIYFAIIAIVQTQAVGAYLLLRGLPSASQLRAFVAEGIEEEKVSLNSDPSSFALASISPKNTVRWATAKLLWRELLVTFWLNWMEMGALLSLLTYALTPYSHGHYKAGLWGGMIMAPLGSMLTLVRVWGQVWHWSSVWAVLGVFIIVNAFVPILANSAVFGGFVVAAVMVTKLFIGYNKALIYIRVQEKDTRQRGGMFLVAVMQQIGSAIGSLVFFILVQYSGAF